MNIQNPSLFDHIIGAGGNTLRPYVYTIGDWNMDTTQTKNITHGLTMTDIVSVMALIRNDANNEVLQLTYAGEYHITGTLIQLVRDNAGTFDSVNYDSTSYNRGYCMVWYLD